MLFRARARASSDGAADDRRVAAAPDACACVECAAWRTERASIPLPLVGRAGMGGAPRLIEKRALTLPALMGLFSSNLGEQYVRSEIEQLRRKQHRRF